MRKIIGVGETVLDIIFRDDQPLKAVPGGSAFNAIVSVGRTHTPCVMATEVGDDHVGALVTRFLKRNNVDTTYVFEAEGTQSHVSLAFLDENNDAQYQFYKNHAVLTMHKNMPEVQAGDVVLFGSYFAINPNLRQYVSAFLHKAHEAGAIIYYDINFRASHLPDLPKVRDFLVENMQLATVVRGSAEDFSILYGLTDGKEVYEEHISKYCPVFIYTDASKPVQVFTPSCRGSFDVEPIETVSTIGAGDNFNAGFCYALLKQGISMPDELLRASLESWKPLIATGLRFSANVCQQLDNYIDEELAAAIRAE